VKRFDRSDPQRGERLLAALLETADDAVVVADAEGRILEVNSSAGRLFGHAPEAMIGRTVDMLMPARWAREHDGYMRRHLETGERRIIGRGRAVEGLRADGTEFPVHLTVGRADAHGEVLFVAILHDLTARRAAERRVERAQRLEAVGELTQGIAHDFNNLLTVVTGNLELLAPRIETERDRELVQDALDAAALGADLIARLLAFARQGDLAPEDIDVDRLIDRTASLLRNSLSEACRLEVRHGPDLWKVHADPAQLQGALLNLALNARDAMPAGGRLTIETSRAEIDDAYIAEELDALPGNYVRISVSDTGEGMSPETQRRAFEPFFTTKSLGRGTGLGLATVYGYIRQTGGHVTIYSEMGRGTTINLYLPAVPERPARAPGAAEAPPRGKGELVLLVEDDAAVRRLSRSRLAALGYTCLEAADGAAARRHLAEHADIALLFTDLVLPGDVSGGDLARQVARERPGVGILLTSGHSWPDTAIAGAAFLRKPYRQAALARCLRSLLHGD
jgi:PAS domain S-box-containing protein